MSYLVQQLWTILLLAFAIGALFGWLLKSWWALRLHTALRDAGARCDASKAEAGRLREDLRSSREQLQEHEQELHQLRGQIRPASTETETAQNAEATSALLQAQLAGSQQRIHELEAQHVESGALLAARMGEAAALRVELERLQTLFKEESGAHRSAQAALQQLRDTAAALEAQKARLARALDDARALHTPIRDPADQLALQSAHTELQQLRTELQRRSDALTELQQLLPSAMPAVTAPLPGNGDDLQRIRGVGPRLASRLHELGIHSWRQIALADASELQRLAAALPGFGSRIFREDWQGQCARLHLQHHGSPP